MDTSPQSRPAEVLRVRGAKQAGEVRARWAWAEAAVWTERMLTALEKGVQGGVWFSLMDKVWSLPNLRAAFARVQANQGSAGVDHQTIAMFAKHLDRELEALNETLRTGTYRPQAIRRVYIPKPGGTEKRPLGIPTVRDRVAQTALRNVLEPIFEHEFAPHSYGFRPRRGCKDALRRVDALLREGYGYVVDADLRSYFDSIPHEALMTQVRTRIADGRVLALIETYLEQGVLEDLQTWTPPDGTPQGAVISPLLSNIYLHPLDQRMAARGREMVRYADDFVILCRTQAQAQAALAAVQAWVKEAGLTLHPEKTRIVEATQRGGFDFLGYHFERGMKWPREKSLKKLRERVREKTPRLSGRSLEAIVNDVNRTLRGWYGYFQHSRASTFATVDGYVRRRLRSLLQWRRDGRGYGLGAAHQRWPNEWFARRGLLSLAAEHEWTRTIVRLRTH